MWGLSQQINLIAWGSSSLTSQVLDDAFIKKTTNFFHGLVWFEVFLALNVVYLMDICVIDDSICTSLCRKITVWDWSAFAVKLIILCFCGFIILLHVFYREHM